MQPSVGTWQWTEYLADARAYVPILFNYVTFAARFTGSMAVGRDESRFPKWIGRPDFVRGYRNSRRIVHTAATRSLSEEEVANAEQRQAAAAQSRAQKAADKAQRDAQAAKKKADRKARLLRLKEDVQPAIAPAAPASEAQPVEKRTTDRSANGSSALAG